MKIDSLLPTFISLGLDNLYKGELRDFNLEAYKEVLGKRLNVEIMFFTRTRTVSAYLSNRWIAMGPTTKSIVHYTRPNEDIKKWNQHGIRNGSWISKELIYWKCGTKITSEQIHAICKALCANENLVQIV